MADRLSKGAVHAIYHGDTTHPYAAAPVLQVLNFKAMPPQHNVPTRYRYLHQLSRILGSSLNPLVESEALKKFTLIRLTKYGHKLLNDDKKIVLMSEIEILDNLLASKIGDPISIDSVDAQNGAQRPNQPSGQHQQPQQATPHQMEPLLAPGGAPIFPIASLSPYQNRWTIMARVTQKSEIKRWQNQRGDGKLFSVNLLDDSGEIKATGFNSELDRWYDVLEEGKVYYISGGRINAAKKQFSTLKNDYEMSLSRETDITLAPEMNAVPDIRFKFVELKDLAGIEEKETVDVIAIVKEVGELTETISQRTNKQVKRRELTLVDQSGVQTRLTLWGNQADTFTTPGENPVVAFKGVTVSNFGGKSLSAFGGSSMKLNPEIPEAFHLKGWYEQQGHNVQFQSHATDFRSSGAPVERMTIEEVKSATVNMDPSSPLMFELKATIVMMSKTESTFCYPACRTPNCNKKVTQETSGWRCEKCSALWPEPEYRYIMGINVSDHTGNHWIQAFNEVGQIITGRNANDLMQNSDEIKPTFDRATFKTYVFKCRAKQEIFSEEAKLRITILNATPVDYVSESNELIKQLQAFGI
ncbi:Replication factor A protein 1 [Actinomortierella ambigua]|nr:Replication factor A protein 1 [Actinomortierella ambigua]